MEQKKVVRKKVKYSEGAKREKTAQELRIEAAVRKRREELANKKKPQAEGSSDPSKYSQATERAEISKQRQVNQSANVVSSSQNSNLSTAIKVSVPKFKKKETFEESHKRVTTYIIEAYHKKLKELRTEYRIPISETINKALDEYFKKHGL